MMAWQLSQWRRWLIIGLAIACCWLLSTPSAWAGLEDDNYDGNIFALYAGNGSLVPPKVSLAQSLKYNKPALLVFYVDDSTDCKRYASVVSQLQAPYGRAANFVPIMADSISPQTDFDQADPGYYFEGVVPQTLVFDAEGNVRLNETGFVSYEKIDDAMREVFDLLPREESVELRRRPINEVNSELVEES
ncbi:MAG: thioredoxin family protein [Leptolyngbya sp. SIOISBB]|nr:thioredoxin family protein [Leptolyngbya sp. SIOISBB]